MAILYNTRLYLLLTDMRRDVQEIFRSTPHGKQVMMFSATLSKEIRPVCKKFMQDVNIYVALLLLLLLLLRPLAIIYCGNTHAIQINLKTTKKQLSHFLPYT